MIPLFLGLTIANLAMLGAVFMLGLFVSDEAGVTRAYDYHLVLGLAAGLLATMTHLAVYMYFMATSKWLRAAADKADLDLAIHVTPALKRKGRTFAVAMTAIVVTMATMFLGAGADPTLSPLWPSEVHLFAAITCIAVHVLCAMVEYRFIREQSDLMDRTLALVNQMPAISVKPV